MLGDPIEIAALTKAFESDETGTCRIGSVKSNIGHCESAAGIAGLTKVLLQMKHGELAPSLHAERLNPHIDFERTPFVVNRELRSWDGARPRLAGISSFGAGGSNAHVIVEEYVEPGRERLELPEVALVLSARTAEQLRQRAQELREYLSREAEADLAAVGYTLQMGREGMEERLAFTASSVEEARRKLTAFLSSGDDAAIMRGQAKRGREALGGFTSDPDFQQTVERWISAGKLGKLLELWTRGMEIDWDKLYDGRKPHKIALPGYPFARERYWIPEATQSEQAKSGEARWLHPLLEANTSDLSEQRFSSHFTGEEFFFRDHRVNGEKALPAAAYVEMARAAIAQASPERREQSALELSEVVWGEPAGAVAELRVALRGEEDGVIEWEIYSGETAHCQGRGRWLDARAAAVDLGRVKAVVPERVAGDAWPEAGVEYGPAFSCVSELHRGTGQALASLRLPEGLTTSARDYVLHPSLLAGAWRTCAALLADAGWSCVSIERVTIYGPCAASMTAWARSTTAEGEQRAIDVDLCAEDGRVCAQLRGLAWEHVAEERQEAPREIELPEVAVAPKHRAKPRRLTLRGPAPFEPAHKPAQRIQLATPIANTNNGRAVRLLDRGRGIFSIELSESGCPIVELEEALAEAARQETLRALVLFLTEGYRESLDLAEFPYPVIAAVRGKAAGEAGLRLTASCDLLVCGEDVEQTALRLAGDIADKPAEALRLLKRHLRQTAVGPSESFDMPLKGNTPAQYSSEPIEIALRSAAVSMRIHADGVVVIRMQDRGSHNLFTAELVSGLEEAFAEVGQRSDAKVVVLTGYDTYFASGGDKQALLAIERGEARFTDTRVWEAALRCPLPVVAAMQGHGIGAGWCLGMFADLVVLSRESHYSSPYMGYGFTPGAGATYILPRRLGQDLATESLLTARSYTGAELEARNASLRVLPRAEVLTAALELARTIAVQPRTRLLEIKRQRIAAEREPLEQCVAQELAMHERTFVGQEAVRAGIERQFGAAAETIESAPRQTAKVDETATIATLRKLLAAELQISEQEISDDGEFVDLGLDSISGVTWIRKINQSYGIAIEATKVYSHPTLRQLSRYVAEETARLAPSLEPSIAPAPEPSTPTRRQTQAPVRALTAHRTLHRRPAGKTTQPPAAIAVIGMAGRFPEAASVDEFWDNIAHGRDCIRPVPNARWNTDEYFRAGAPQAGKSNSRWAGMLDSYDCFDPLFFNLSPAEAEMMEPQQRLFLETCYHAIENAGYNPRALSGSRCGVFAGCAAGDYYRGAHDAQVSAQAFTGGAMSILAARISYFLNLQGPCVSIDTACSSSLVATAQACESLLAGSSDVALAGGVYVMTGPQMHIMTSQAGMLSPEGRCFSFDARAEGFVPGEGVGVALLKRLADAERDGDRIVCVLRGWGVNQDGRTNGITAPNPESQTRLEREIYGKFAIEPQRIGLVEAHGTGTKLGDPIEVEALQAAFRGYTDKTSYCALGSVKSNIGHCLTAAGIAGLIKAACALQHRQLPPAAGFEKLNEHIRLEGSPFYVNTSLRAWPEVEGVGRRQAAVSSFGFSGTNAHLIVEEYVEPARSRMAPGEVALVLSARTAEQLRQRAHQLREYLEREPEADLAAVGYTLQVGREAMDERLAFTASSMEEACRKLEEFLAGGNGAGVWRGQARRGREALGAFTSDP